MKFSAVIFGLVLTLTFLMVKEAEGSNLTRIRFSRNRSRNRNRDSESGMGAAHMMGAQTTGSLERMMSNYGYRENTDVSSLTETFDNFNLGAGTSGPTSGYAYGNNTYSAYGDTGAGSSGPTSGYAYGNNTYSAHGDTGAGSSSPTSGYAYGNNTYSQFESTENEEHRRSRSGSIARSSTKRVSRKQKEEFNVDNLQYDGEPITFACIDRYSRREFYLVHATDSISSYLIDRLDNGRGLSLFFLGAANEINSADGLLFKFAREWFTGSGNNICFVTYCYSEKPTGGCQAFDYLDKLVSTNRLEYVAKMARDLVWGVQVKSFNSNGGESCLTMSQVDVTGFSFGAHIAGRTAEYLLHKTGEKVRMLLALDPSRTPPTKAFPGATIVKEFAEYVQVIHTSNVLGISSRLGHVDIYVRLNSGCFIKNNHALAFFLHVATATKRLYLAADETEKGKGSLVKVDGDNLPQPRSEECQLGIYATLNPNHIGKKFGLSLTKRDSFFFEQLGQYNDAIIFTD